MRFVAASGECAVRQHSKDATMRHPWAYGLLLATLAGCGSMGSTSNQPDAVVVSDIGTPTMDVGTDVPAVDASVDGVTDLGDTGPVCMAGQTLCGGACVTPAMDPGNCGACGHGCASGQSCVAGSCVTPV